MTEALLEEYRDVAPRLLADGKIDQAQLESLVTGIAAFASAARVVKPRRPIAICRDPERLMRFLNALGWDLRIIVESKSRRRPGRMIVEAS